MKGCRIIIVCAILLFALSCATPGAVQSSSVRPDWLEGSSSQYPSNSFITGVGYGSDRDAAKEKARAEIAKVFKVRIQQRSAELEKFFQISTGGKEASGSFQNFEQLTQSSTEKILTGVEIRDTYTDKASSPPTYYALAVLSRRQATNSLSEKINDLDKEIADLLKQGSSSNDKVSAIQFYKKAIGKQVLRETFNEELRVVNPDGGGIKSQLTLEEIKNRLTKILRNEFNLSVVVTGQRANDVKQAIMQGLTKQGFVINPRTSEAAVLIEGSVELTPADIPHQKWHFTRWSVDFKLIDQRDGKVFGSFTEEDKEGHLSASEAEKRAVRKMKEELTERIGEELSQYIYGQTPSSD